MDIHSLDLAGMLSVCLYAIIIAIVFKCADRLIRIPYIRDVQARYILVTGCDTGFGHEIARRLDRHQCHVFAGCLTAQGASRLRQVCSHRLVALSLDVTKSDSVRKAYDVIVSELPPNTGVWGVVNNAGVSGKWGPAEWLRYQDYQDVMAVNLHGIIDVTATFLPLIKKARGRIVNMSSMLGRTTKALGAPYCISKHGVEAFSDVIRRELYPYGCSVHIVEPGYYNTPMGDPDVRRQTAIDMWNHVPPQIQQLYGTAYFQALLFAKRPASDRLCDVIDTYEHALLGRFPRARYVVGNDAKYVWLPVQALP